MTFQSEQQVYRVLQAVFERLKENPKSTETFSHSNLVVRVRFTNPEAEVLFDGRQPPLELFYGPRPGDANLEMLLPTDLLHKIWLGEEKLTDALFHGQIKTKGNLLKASSFIELFRACEEIYPEVMRNS